MRRIRVLLADDHTFFLETLELLLTPKYELVGTVTDGQALLAAASELHPDVIVMDISMPHLDGLEAARRLTGLMPAAKLIFLTMHEDVEYVKQALQAGASGYLSKRSSTPEIFRAIEEALAGRVYVSPLVVNGMLHEFGHKPKLEKTSAEKDSLTPRQREVLSLLTEGYSMKEIGSALHVTPRTVAFHKYRMMEALGISSSAKLIQYAIEHGHTEATDIPVN